MEPSREFQCPGCKRSLTMSDAMHMRAIVHQQGGSYVAFGETDVIRCPACDTAIQGEDVVAGRHSLPRSGCLGEIAELVGAFAILGGIIAGLIYLFG